MQDQNVDAIGGPNITPWTDGWTARCVAVSPGNPSHVMLDDQRAEHVPGCNMAFRRDVLLGLGGFDPQFRQAGDDVDLCWRLLDEGRQIGFAAAAMVWHHRRCTARAYLKQQKGYGRAEAMVQFKHPQRFANHGRPIFHGVIYGDGAVGLPVLPPRIYHGRFGSAPFQTIYRQQVYGLRSWMTSLEWHALAMFFAILGVLSPMFWAAAGMMWASTLAVAVSYGIKAKLPPGAPIWCRPLVMFLHIAQPVIRSWHRWLYRLRHKTLPPLNDPLRDSSSTVKKISGSVRDLYWDNQKGIGRERLLEELEREARNLDWSGDFNGIWTPWDVELDGNLWHSIRIHTVTEELGWPRRFTRARCLTRLTLTSKVMGGMILLWMLAAALTSHWGAALGGAVVAVVLLCVWAWSRARCLRQVTRLLTRTALRAELEPPLPKVIPPAHPLPLKRKTAPPARVPEEMDPAAIPSFSARNPT
jgi:hypothetical protein